MFAVAWGGCCSISDDLSCFCLRPKLWSGMVRQPNSGSKRQGICIQHVSAYCQDGKKYVGCTELLFKLADSSTDCILCFALLWSWPLAHIPENSQGGWVRYCLYTSHVSWKYVDKITEKITYTRLSKVDSSWPWPLTYRNVQKFASGCPLIKDYLPAKHDKFKDLVINDREITECAFSCSVTLWPWPLHQKCM